MYSKYVIIDIAFLKCFPWNKQLLEQIISHISYFLGIVVVYTIILWTVSECFFPMSPHFLLVDFVVLPLGNGRSVADF